MGFCNKMLFVVGSLLWSVSSYGQVTETGWLTDGGFETPENNEWTYDVVKGVSPFADTNYTNLALSGRNWLWFGGVVEPTEAHVTRSFYIDSLRDFFSFWIAMPACDGIADTIIVSLGEKMTWMATGAHSFCGSPAYHLVKMKMDSAYLGTTQAISISGYTNAKNNNLTNFFIDDIGLPECDSMRAEFTVFPDNNGDGTGAASAIMFQGHAPYTYQWDANTGEQVGMTASKLNRGSYRVAVEDHFGCEGSFKVFVDGAVGTKDLISQERTVFYAPSSNQLVQKQFTYQSFKVFSLSGALVEQGEFTHKTATLSGLTTGTYLVELQGETRRTNLKIVVWP